MNIIPSLRTSFSYAKQKPQKINLFFSRNFKKFPHNLETHNVKYSIISRNKATILPGLSIKSAGSVNRINYASSFHISNLFNCLQIRHFAATKDTSFSKNGLHNKANMLDRTAKNDDSVDVEMREEVELENVSKLFPMPKAVVNNVYASVARELSRSDLKLTITYKPLRRSNNVVLWTCTYHTKWPEDMKFTKSASTKQNASHKAALAVLLWLKSLNKIDKSGTPLVYEKEQIKDIKNTKIPVLKLDGDTETYLNEIVNLYDQELHRHVLKNREIHEKKNEENQDTCEEEFEKLWPTLTKRHVETFADSFYKACEPVHLPISDFKEKIKTIISNNRVVILKGEPGCGKSTRVPQYVLEALAENKKLGQGPNRIIVTQPRRIAAISLSDRVASEREELSGEIVGYQVRLHSKFNPKMGRILYCTTGILLRRIQTDPTLSDCSYIILDEAHERDVNTDLLMNLVKQTLKVNPNLKVIVMSATMDTKVFQNYFEEAEVIHIPGFTYPVKVNFLDDIKGVNLSKTKEMCSGISPQVVCEDVVKVIEHIHKKQGEGAILCFLPGWEEIMKIKRLIPPSDSMSVLPLHSRLQDSDQRKIFSRVPPGVRKVILATNIAETSVTIDDVVYVIDTGIHKEQRFDSEKGVMCIDNHWISKSSMAQRKGRAGRVQEGVSMHLYPESKYETFSTYSLPEILRTSLTKIVLDSKVYSQNMDAVKFLQQLPCSPDEEVIQKAVDELKELELLDENENLTALGKTVSEFQLEPKLSKAMVNAVVFKCVTPIVDIVTLFSAETELFETGLIDKESVKGTKESYSKSSDHLSLMRIFEKWLNCRPEEARDFCLENNLTPYKFKTLEKLRQIHLEYLHKGLYDVLPISDDSSDCDELVKGVLLSGVGNVLVHRTWDIAKGKFKTTNIFLTRNNHKATITSESVNFKRNKFPTDYLVYINETRSNIRRTTVVRECSLISPLSVLLFKNSELEIDNLDDKNTREDFDSTDQVLVRLKGTKVELICDRKQAELIMRCKDTLKQVLQYYIDQLTTGNDFNLDFNKSWDSVLQKLTYALEE